MVPKRHKSKRLSLHQKYKIEKRILQHHKKARREARKNPKKTSKKDKSIGIPNNFPFKEELLLQVEEEKRRIEEEKQQRKAERKAAKAQNNLTPSLTTTTTAPQPLIAPVVSKSKQDSLIVDFMTVTENVDIILEVIDARDPIGTRTLAIEESLVKDNKLIIIVMTKIDLVPRETVDEWIKYFNAEYPVVPIMNGTPENKNKSLGYETLIKYCKSYRDSIKSKTDVKEKPVTVGVIGFPGCGKYTLIENLRKYHDKEHEIKIDSLITLGENLTLLDCPGIVFVFQEEDNSNIAEVMIRNCVKPKLIPNAEICVTSILKRCSNDQLCKMYKVPPFIDYNDFLLQVGRAKHLVKLNGNTNIRDIGTIVITDFKQNRIPNYTVLPKDHEIPAESKICKDLKKKIGYDTKDIDEILKNIKSKCQFPYKLYVIKGYDYAKVDMNRENYFGDENLDDEMEEDENENGEIEEIEVNEDDDDDDEPPMAVPIEEDNDDEDEDEEEDDNE
jgi:nuclear GTP-binding protein